MLAKSSGGFGWVSSSPGEGIGGRLTGGEIVERALMRLSRRGVGVGGVSFMDGSTGGCPCVSGGSITYGVSVASLG